MYGVLIVFYNRFLDLCRTRGITPSRAADEIGINRSSVTSWKNNGYTPQGDNLNKVARYFDVSTDYLLGKTDNKKAPATEGEREIGYDDFTYAFFDESKELTDENKQKLLEMARFFKQQQDKEKNE